MSVHHQSDLHSPARFNISSLSTVGMMYPSFWPVPLAGCAHWIREPGTASCLSIPPLLPPGTDNSINFQYKSGLTGPYVEVQRYRPQDPFHDPQVWTVAGLLDRPMD